MSGVVIINVTEFAVNICKNIIFEIMILFFRFYLLKSYSSDPKQELGKGIILHILSKIDIVIMSHFIYSFKTLFIKLINSIN